MAEAREYTVSIKWIEEDGENFYQASVREFPDLFVYEDTYDEAYREILDAIATTLAALAEQGSFVPPPEKNKAADQYSGRTTVRMSKSLHQRAAIAAEADDISLNQWIVEAVAWRLNGARTAPTVMAPNAVSVTIQSASLHGLYYPSHSVGGGIANPKDIHPGVLEMNVGQYLISQPKQLITA